MMESGHARVFLAQLVTPRVAGDPPTVSAAPVLLVASDWCRYPRLIAAFSYC